MGRKVQFYNAASSEVFGDINGAAADESTPFSPRSPYAVAKATGRVISVALSITYGRLRQRDCVSVYKLQNISKFMPLYLVILSQMIG